MNYLQDQRDRVAEDPRYSVRDVQAADSFVTTWERRWTAQVMEQVRDREADHKQKVQDTYSRIRDEQREADADRAALEAGDLDYKEFMNRRRLRLSRVGELEHRYDGLVSSQTLIQEMRDDPVGWMDAFYEKWLPLRDRRPNIDGWIEEARRHRSSR